MIQKIGITIIRDVDVNMVGYDMVNMSIGYCIVQLGDMKYNLSMRVLRKTNICIFESNEVKYIILGHEYCITTK